MGHHWIKPWNMPRLGQFIASSPTVFPAEYVKEFQACWGPGQVSTQWIRKVKLVKKLW